MLPGKNERGYDVLFHILMFFSFFSCIFALFFKNDILPTITETVLLSYSLIFFGAFFSYFYQATQIHNVLMAVASVPTIMTLYIFFKKPALNFSMKLILYTWFLCMIVCLGFFQFPFSQLAIFFKDKQVPWGTYFESLSAGMAFLFLAANATYVYDLVPIPERNQSWADGMKEWHEHTNLLTQRVSDDGTLENKAMILLGVELLLLTLNFIHTWLTPGLIINLSIVLSGILFFVNRPTARNQESAEAVVKSRVPHSRHFLKKKFLDQKANNDDDQKG